MRFESKKRAKKRRIVTYRRQMFLAEFRDCWFCGSGTNLCVHEIACGSHRDKALGERLAWAVACFECNCHQLTDYSMWPLERQLAIKKLRDPRFYNRVEFNRLRGRADNAITQAEVTAWVRKEIARG